MWTKGCSRLTAAVSILWLVLCFIGRGVRAAAPSAEVPRRWRAPGGGGRGGGGGGNGGAGAPLAEREAGASESPTRPNPQVLHQFSQRRARLRRNGSVTPSFAIVRPAYFLASRQAIQAALPPEQQSARYSNMWDLCGRAYRFLSWASVSQLVERGGCKHGGDWQRLFEALLREPPTSRANDHSSSVKRRSESRAQLLNMSIVTCSGDCIHAAPPGTIFLSKSRTIGAPAAERTATLLPLNIGRHLTPIAAALNDSIAFKDKLPIAVWRGVTTGGCWDLASGPSLELPRPPPEHLPTCPRYNLFARWGNASSNHADVAITGVVQMNETQSSLFKKVMRPEMPMTELLRFRYLVSVEGNDVATNLKWALASNSVVLMPPPRVETFFGEGLLRAHVHYIPLLPDTSDLEEKVRYCESHLSQCEAVAREGRRYAARYQDLDTVFADGVHVLRRHIGILQGLQ